MTSHLPTRFRLASLRSTRFAIIAIVILMLNMVTVAVTVPGDVVELVHAAEHSLSNDVSHADDGDEEHPCGNHVHAGCHQVVTVPLLLSTLTVPLNLAPPEPMRAARANAPIKTELRPPIV